MARPSKYTYSRVRRILKHIRNGGTKRGACGAAGIGETTMIVWEANKSGLSEAVKRAQAHGLRSDLSRLDTFVRDGNLTALLARLKMVHGLSDRVTVQNTGTAKNEHKHKITEAEKEYKTAGESVKNRIKELLREPSAN